MRPIKKRKKAKKLHTERRESLGIAGEAVPEKEKGIVTVSKLCQC